MRFRSPHEGFSLVEVMVALIVMSVGLLGIAKMQALALSSTTSARMRSLAALEASSLASTLRADRAYWSNVTADPAVQFANGAISQTADGTLAAPGGPCPCTAPQIAYSDIQQWLQDLGNQVPNAQGTINCNVAAGAPATPVSCTIQLSWQEKLVAANAQQSAQIQATSGSETISYTLYVDP